MRNHASAEVGLVGYEGFLGLPMVFEHRPILDSCESSNRGTGASNQGRETNPFAPLSKAGRSCVSGCSRHTVVEAAVLGGRHVRHVFCHGLGHAEFDKPGFASPEWDLLEVDRLAQHLGHDLRHVVERQVLRAEGRDVVLSAP